MDKDKLNKLKIKIDKYLEKYFIEETFDICKSTTASIAEFETAPTFQETLLKFIDTFGSDRILFATDCPWMNQKESIDTFNSFKRIKEEDRENILYKNAIRLLNIKRS